MIFFSTDFTATNFWVYDIKNDPKFLYHSAVEFASPMMFVYNEHLLVASSSPLLANGLVMSLSITDNLSAGAKFSLEDAAKLNANDQV